MVDPKGQNILFRNQLAQKEQLIQMQNERLAEQTETIKDLRSIKLYLNMYNKY